MRPNRCSSEEFMQILEDRISNLEQDNNYVTSSQTIKASEELDEAMRKALWDIADRYVTSDPVSGEWSTETEHEMRAIQEELGVDEATAQRYMIEVLGFSPEEFESMNKQGAVEKEVLDVLAKNGYDVSTEAAKNLANAAAMYICQWPEDEYDAATWFEDTKQNYPEDLAEIESACNTTGMPAAVTQLDDVDKIEGCGINCSEYGDETVTLDTIFDWVIFSENERGQAVYEDFTGTVIEALNEMASGRKPDFADSAVELNIENEEEKEAILDALISQLAGTDYSYMIRYLQ